MKQIWIEFAAVLSFLLIYTDAFAMCGVCGSGAEGKHAHGGEFSAAAEEASMKNGVKEITYKQFMRIRNSGEKYVLLDVLSASSYRKAHIEGAASFPLDSINEKTASKSLSKDDHIVVYCGGFQCAASTDAARKLSGLGYSVVDYKGGLEEWQERGNAPVSGS